MDNYLWLLMIIYFCEWLFLLFVIINIFGVKSIFFVIICNHLFVYLFKNIFIVISSIDKWVSQLKMTKQKILGNKKFKILKNYLAYWGFAKCLF